MVLVFIMYAWECTFNAEYIGLKLYFICRVGKYEYKRGVTEVLSTVVRPIEIVSETVKMVSEEEMDTA